MIILLRFEQVFFFKLTVNTVKFIFWFPFLNFWQCIELYFLVFMSVTENEITSKTWPSSPLANLPE